MVIIIKDFFHSVGFKIIAAIMALLLGVMIYSATAEGTMSPFGSVWEKIISPVQKVFSQASASISGAFDSMFNSENYRTENQSLQSEINRLKNDLIDYEKLKKENEDLRTMLELTTENEGFTFSPPCSIIARAVNDPYKGFTINGGSNYDISPGDPVVTSEGIIGVCVDVSDSSTTVRTLYSPKTAVYVYSLETNTSGIIEGGYDYSKDGLCKMSYIDKSLEINVGDTVVTAGSENYPSGQLVGTVTETGTEDSGLSKYALVKPAVNPESVTDVFVITSFSNDNVENVENIENETEEEIK